MLRCNFKGFHERTVSVVRSMTILKSFQRTCAQSKEDLGIQMVIFYDDNTP